MDAFKFIAQVSRRYLGVEVKYVPPRSRKPPKVSWWPPTQWTNAFIAGPDFLSTWQWAKVRYRRLDASDGCCEACGRTRRDGARLNVDHIWPRKTHPHLALTFEKTQLLCDLCNQGKGNQSVRDWRTTR